MTNPNSTLQQFIFYFGLPHSNDAFCLNLTNHENSESNAFNRASAYLTKINNGRKVKFSFLLEIEVRATRQNFRIITELEFKEGYLGRLQTESKIKYNKVLPNN